MSFISKSKPGIPSIQTDHGLTLNDYDSANAIASQLASVYTFPSQAPPVQPQYPSLPCIRPLTFSVLDVRKKLLRLQSGKSSGPDGIPPKFIKECADVLAYPLYLLFTHSLQKGSLPLDWKRCVITPLHKGGARNNASNYRPIALLSCISKILESLIDDHLREHLLGVNFLSPLQHGFRPVHSCTTNLLLAVDSWTKLMEAKHKVDVVYLDFAKAFDRVDHLILLNKVYSCGIRGDLYTWLQDYLHERSFNVRVHGTMSQPFPAPKGVPQGSIVGPLLFLIFINDIITTTLNPCLMYADDIKIWTPISSTHSGNSLQLDLNTLSEWSLINNLPFNASKCSVLHIKQPQPRSYHLNGSLLQPVTTQKDLGTIISSTLGFSENSSNLARKANGVMHLLHRNLGRLNQNSFSVIFKSIVRPLLEINSQACTPTLKMDLDSLENVQRRATKRVLGLKHKEYSSRLHTLKLYSLKYRRLRGDMILTHKILNTPNHPCQSLIKLKAINNLRGHPLRIEHERCKLNARYFSFAVRVPREWNQLPSKVVTSASTIEFKHALDSHHQKLLYSL